MKVITHHKQLYTTDQIYALDKAFIATGISSIQLIKRAAQAAFDLLQKLYPGQPVRIFCGGGNNAADGYLLAGLLAQRKINVEVVQIIATEKIIGDVKVACEFAKEQDVRFYSLSTQTAITNGVLVDALLGIGTRGVIRENIAAAIEWMNESGLPIVSLDIPSGLNPDTGAVLDSVIQARHTLTFIGLKQGLLTGKGPAVCGELHLADLQISSSIIATQIATTKRILLDQELELLKPRKADAHKGDFGHVMVIGGDSGYGGAALMAAEAAARAGAGLVSLATRPEHIVAALVRCPEIMVKGVVSGQELEPLLARPTVLVVGPGLGRSSWSEQMLQQAVKSGLPMILDADALNILAEGRVVNLQKDELMQTKKTSWILTPHPAEAARLLGITTAEIQANRFEAIEKLQKMYGACVILKGVGSLVADEKSSISIVTAGNPGMATGGMGDVLSGILGALVAQGLSLGDAARLGAVLHATAADRAAEVKGQISLMATDLIPYLCELLASVDQQGNTNE